MVQKNQILPVVPDPRGVVRHYRKPEEQLSEAHGVSDGFSCSIKSVGCQLSRMRKCRVSGMRELREARSTLACPKRSELGLINPELIPVSKA